MVECKRSIKHIKLYSTSRFIFNHIQLLLFLRGLSQTFYFYKSYYLLSIAFKLTFKLSNFQLEHFYLRKIWNGINIAHNRKISYLSGLKLTNNIPFKICEYSRTFAIFPTTNNYSLPVIIPTSIDKHNDILIYN